MPVKEDDEIAVVGVGCRFPGADDVAAFWRVLSRGENHVREIPGDKWDVNTVYDVDPNAVSKTNVRQAGFVKEWVFVFMCFLFLWYRDILVLKASWKIDIVKWVLSLNKVFIINIIVAFFLFVLFNNFYISSGFVGV